MTSTTEFDTDHRTNHHTRTTPITPLLKPRRANVIDKVRAMLAKASSTDHEPEREAFEAKAQALITRYQIEARELSDAESEVQERRIDVKTWSEATRGVIYLYGGIAELNRSSAAHRSVGGLQPGHPFRHRGRSRSGRDDGRPSAAPTSYAHAARSTQVTNELRHRLDP